MEFSKQEYWSGLPFPPPEDLPDSGIEPASIVSPALAGGFFTNCTSFFCSVKFSFYGSSLGFTLGFGFQLWVMFH